MRCTLGTLDDLAEPVPFLETDSPKKTGTPWPPPVLPLFSPPYPFPRLLPALGSGPWCRYSPAD